MSPNPVDWRTQAGASLPKLPFAQRQVKLPDIHPRLSPIAVRLTAPSVYRLGEPIVIQFEVQNISTDIYQLLTWDTPLKGALTADCFTVLHGGQIIPYDGRFISRCNPALSEYVTLHPGQVLTVDADLSTVYAIEQTGEYTVVFSGIFFDAFTIQSGAIQEPHRRNDFQRLVPISGTVRFDVAEFRPPIPTEGQRYRISVAEILPGRVPGVRTSGGRGGGAGPEFEGFNTQQEAELVLAHETAKHYADLACDYFINNPTGPEDLYNTWFGAFDQGRYNCVKSHYSDIRDILSSGEILYKYDQEYIFDPSAVAHSFPAILGMEWHEIWICERFFTLLAHSGMDISMFGVIIHECSHMCCGTADFSYGAVDDQALASDSPFLAIFCADNHQLFVDALSESDYGRVLSINLDQDWAVGNETQAIGLKIEIDNCRPDLLDIDQSDLGATPGVKPAILLTPSVPGMTVEITSLDAEDNALPDMPLKFIWRGQLAFTDDSGFPTNPGQVNIVTVTATLISRFSDSTHVRLMFVQLTNLSLVPGTVTAGEQVRGMVKLSGPSPSDVVVHLDSDNSVAVVPQVVTIHAQEDSANFTVSTQNFNPQAASTRTAMITATLGSTSIKKRLIVKSYGNNPEP